MRRVNENLIYIVVLLIGVVLLVVAAWNPLPADYHWLTDVLKELGMALCIAIVLSFTIEKFSKNRHLESSRILIEKINRNLFKAIYDRYIPEPVFAEVERCVMKSDVFRTDYKVVYTIKDMRPAFDDAIDSTTHALCEAESQYTLTNITDGAITHTIKLALEKPIDEAWVKYCKIERCSVSGESLDSNALSSHTRTEANQVVFSYDIELQPRGSVAILTKARLIKRQVDSEIWASRLPSDGFELTVISSDNNYEINASANHSEKMEERKFGEGAIQWTLNHGIFPHQSVVFWWQRREDC